jgi:hypothetical protein
MTSGRSSVCENGYGRSGTASWLAGAEPAPRGSLCGALHIGDEHGSDVPVRRGAVQTEQLSWCARTPALDEKAADADGADAGAK